MTKKKNPEHKTYTLVIHTRESHNESDEHGIMKVFPDAIELLNWLSETIREDVNWALENGKSNLAIEMIKAKDIALPAFFDWYTEKKPDQYEFYLVGREEDERLIFTCILIENK